MSELKPPASSFKILAELLASAGLAPMNGTGSKSLRLLRQVGFASIVSCATLGVTVFLGDGAGGVGVFSFLFPACVLSSWTGGALGGVLATVILALGAAYYHLPPAGLPVADSAHVLALCAFILSGILISRLVGALQHSLAIVNCTLQSIGDGLITADHRNRVQLMNPVAEALTGWSMRDAFGRPLVEVLRSVTATSGGNAGSLAILAMRERRVVSLPDDSILVPKSGNGHPLDDSVAPIQSSAGDVLGSVIVFRDATPRKEAEAALIQAETRYREIFENAVVGMFQSTPDGRYLKVNQALAEMHGYRSPQEMVEATAELPHQMPLDPGVHNEFRHLLEEKKIVNAFPMEVLRRDGIRVSTMVNARAVCDAVGTVLYYEGTQEDVTEQTRLQLQVEQAQKMEAIGRLAGGVAHDFNNILGVIYGYTEIAKEKVDRNHPILRDLTLIREAAARAAHLTKQLLAFSRRQPVHPTALDLNKIVSGLSQMLERLVGEDVTISVKPADGLGLIVADSGQIEQILMNLSVNARDAMPLGGKIKIETANVTLDKEYAKQHRPAAPGSYVVLSFSDNGHGIENHLLTKIFEPFFTTKEVGKGTGLGLATVYGIVKHCNGNIWVYSEPGFGTTFKLYFPRVDLNETLAAPASQTAFQGGTETILLVEDDVHMRETVCNMLEGAGYVVLKPESSTAALELALKDSQSIDLLLTDIVMPNLSGVELQSRVRTARPRIKLLYMTGYNGGDLAHRGLLESSVAVLEKPFTLNELLSGVRAVLDRDD
jgi:two-component system cell cycle sensor histidine kinase/response regulator CckA